MNSFLPTNYEVPKSESPYLKFEEGANKFRIVSSAVIGYEYWTEDNKPVRLKEMPKSIPADMRKDSESKIKHFWAFTVLDRADGRVKILELTQATIMRAVKSLVDNEDWGNPTGYDINVSRTGKGIETEYTVQPSPHKPLTDEENETIDETPVNLEALFTGENPFEETVNIDKL